MSNSEQFFVESASTPQSTSVAMTAYNTYKADRDLQITALLLDASGAGGPVSNQTFRMRLYDAAGALLGASSTVYGPTGGAISVVQFPLPTVVQMLQNTTFIVAVWMSAGSSFGYYASQQSVGTTKTSPNGVTFTRVALPKQHLSDTVVPSTDSTFASVSAGVGLEYQFGNDSVGILTA